MIKIISTALRVTSRFFPAKMMTFSMATSEITPDKKEKTDKIAKKTQNINSMFTDKGIEESKEKKITNGRAWKASELRLKSNEDLHKLWYVCVREKNLVLADELAMDYDPTYTRKAGKIRRYEKLQLTMRRILFVITERENMKKQYRKQLQDEYIQKKKAELESSLKEAPQPLPEITFEMLRSKYQALRKGIDNVDYLEKILSKKETTEARYQRADQRVSKLDPEKQFQSFWKYEMAIGERPTQMEILKTHIKNWKSLNLKQRKIILGFLNARRSKDAKAEFKKELKILGQKIAFEEAKSRTETKTESN